MSIRSGVLFCGGCNPRFDRLKLYQELIAQFSPEGARKWRAPEISFSHYQEGQPYDFVLLINGCGSECLLNEEFQRPVVLLRQGDLPEACNKILRLIEKI